MSAHLEMINELKIFLIGISKKALFIDINVDSNELPIPDTFIINQWSRIFSLEFIYSHLRTIRDEIAEYNFLINFFDFDVEQTFFLGNVFLFFYGFQYLLFQLQNPTFFYIRYNETKNNFIKEWIGIDNRYVKIIYLEKNKYLLCIKGKYILCTSNILVQNINIISYYLDIRNLFFDDAIYGNKILQSQKYNFIIKFLSVLMKLPKDVTRLIICRILIIDKWDIFFS